MGGNALSARTGWPERLWGPDRGGLIEEGTGVPGISFSGNTPYSGLGNPWGGRQGGPGFNTNNRYQFSNDLTWVKGRNTIKMGIEFRHHQYPFRQWGASPGGRFNFNRLQTGGYDTSGNNLPSTGDPYASFILGQVHNGTFHIPAEPTFYERYVAPWVNVDSKVTNNLTLTLGLRWDYQTSRIEARDMYSTFDLNTPNPGAGGLLGAQVFAGTGPGRTGSRKFENPPRDAWGPRFGFAYRVGDKNVVRGGYGIYYSGVAHSQFTGLPILGFENFPAANNTNGGLTATYHWDDGIPRDLIIRPPFIDPTVSLNQAPITVASDDLTLPRYQNWVSHPSTAAKRQHGPGCIVCRQSGHKADKPRDLDGPVEQHEPPVCDRVRGRGSQLGHQFPGCAGCRHWASVSGLCRKRCPGPSPVPAYPVHPVEERANGQQHLPFDAVEAGQAIR